MFKLLKKMAQITLTTESNIVDAVSGHALLGFKLRYYTCVLGQQLVQIFLKICAWSTEISENYSANQRRVRFILKLSC